MHDRFLLGSVLGAAALLVAGCADHSSDTIGGGNLASLVILNQPAGPIVAGTSLGSVRVGYQNADGQPLVASVPITVELMTPGIGASSLLATTGEPQLLGTLTVDPNSGVAEFGDLVVQTAASGFALRFDAEGFSPAMSDLFDVTAGSAAGLAIDQGPSDVVVGGTIAPSIRVEVVDAFGNRVESENQATVSVMLESVPGPGVLSGTVTANVAAGVAEFSDLSVDVRGRGYTMRFASAALTSVDSNAFKVFDPGWAIQESRIGASDGGFSGVLEFGDDFGFAVAPLGDLNGDGVVDVAVGARGDSDSGTEAGAVWILFLQADGTVASHQKITSSVGGFTGVLADLDHFGVALGNIGDLDGDGVDDLAVGADGDGDLIVGSVWILFMQQNGTVRGHQQITAGVGGFSGTISGPDRFGSSVSSARDIDSDGVVDLLVGARNDNGTGISRGAAWLLFMNRNGTVRAQQKIGDGEGGFVGRLRNGDLFGTALAPIGDLDGDGTPDVAIGARADDDGGVNAGALWILFMRPDGTVASHQKISATEGNLVGQLNAFDGFASGLGQLSDLDGDGVAELAAGAPFDDDGRENTGAIYVLFLASDGTVASHRKISTTQGGFTGVLDPFDFFGYSVAGLGDLDQDGVEDMVGGAIGDDDLALGDGTLTQDIGAVWLVRLDGK